jgi:hypothetical protein
MHASDITKWKRQRGFIQGCRLAFLKALAIEKNGLVNWSFLGFFQMLKNNHLFLGLSVNI